MFERGEMKKVKFEGAFNVEMIKKKHEPRDAIKRHKEALHESTRGKKKTD